MEGLSFPSDGKRLYPPILDKRKRPDVARDRAALPTHAGVILSVGDVGNYLSRCPPFRIIPPLPFIHPFPIPLPPPLLVGIPHGLVPLVIPRLHGHKAGMAFPGRT